MVNQFSFWPRYDEFVPLPANAERDPDDLHRGRGVNLFVGRTALYCRWERNIHCPAASAAAGRTELIDTIEVRTDDRLLREVQVYACYDYHTMPL